MNKKLFFKAVGLLLIGSMCVFGIACSPVKSKAAKVESQKVDKQETEIIVKEIKIDEKYITANANIPVISNMKNKAIEKRINNLFENDIKDFLDMQVQSAKYLYKEGDKDYIKDKIAISYETTYQNEDIVSLVIEKRMNEDKEYPYTLKNFYNIDLNSGKQIPLSRLIDSSEDYKQVIKDYIDKNLKDGKEKIYIGKSKIKENKYYLKDKSIFVYFEPYEIGLDATDNSIFEIPFEAFKNDIKTKVQLNPYGVKVDTKKINDEEEYFQGNINIPVISGLEDEKIQNKLNKMFEEEAIEFKDEVKGFAKEGADDAKKFNYEMRPYVADVTFQEKKNEKDLLSIYVVYYQYTGGAHGMHDDVTYNIDLKTGELIELKDLFKEGYDYKKAINEKIKAQINEIQEEYKERALSEGQKTEDIYLPYQGFKEIGEDQNFYLEDDKLIIYFGLYEIECYAAGIPTFEIYFSDLEEGLKKESK